MREALPPPAVVPGARFAAPRSAVRRARISFRVAFPGSLLQAFNAVRGCTATRSSTHAFTVLPGVAPARVESGNPGAATDGCSPRRRGRHRRRPIQSRRQIRHARPRRGHGIAQCAADHRPAGRRDGHRCRRDPAQRCAKPAAVAATPARRRSRDCGRSRFDVGGIPARRQRGPDAGADRRPPCRIDVVRRHHAGGHPARPDRTHRDPARTGVEPLRRRRDRWRDPGLHQAGRRQRLLRQCRGRLRHLRHAQRQRRLARRARAAAFFRASRRNAQRRLQRHREPAQFQLQRRP